MKKILLLIKLAFIILIIFLGFINIKIVAALSKINDFDIDKIYKPKTTTLYDLNNKVIFELGTKKRDWVSYNDISSNMINALVSIEDKNFFKHRGIDYFRILSATLNNLSTKSFSEGASTLTQQLIKNTMLTRKKTLERKIQELYLSMQLESKLTKMQIIEAYLNNVLFGSNIYGIQRASLYYFNKNAKDLNINEAATLAGLIQLPNFYNPYKNLEASKKRRNLVLKMMYENNYISYNDLKNISKENIILDDSYDLNINKLEYIDSYVDYVIFECKNKYNINPYAGKLDIYCNINLDMQKNIYEIMSNKNEIFPDDILKSGIVLIDSKSGHIEGLGGSRNNNIGDINYAYEVKLQPGSTIKPILDYGPALEYLEYSPASIIVDDKTFYQTGQVINNWDHLYKGEITLRRALMESRNVPAYKLYMEVGFDRAHQFMRNFDLFSDTYYESQALGGFKEGFSVLDMTNAYQAIANKGKFIKASSISYIKLNDEIIKMPSKTKITMRETTSFLLSSMLEDVIKYSLINIDNMRLSGKTGQTNYDHETIEKYNIPANATKDSWMIGFNNYKTLGIWVGYDYISETTYLNSQKKDIPKIIFEELMIKSNNFDNTALVMPQGLVKKNISYKGNQIYVDNTSKLNDYFYLYNAPSVELKKVKDK